MFLNDIDALVSETFNHSKVLTGNSHRDPLFDFKFNENIADNDEDSFQDISDIFDIETPDQVPGVFYHLEKKASTFVIRILESRDLSIDYPKILNNPENYPILRLCGDHEIALEDQLQFFECDLFELAKGIKTELANKRFPIFEERVFNVSDPGDSWWVKADSDEVKIFFKLSRTESMDSLIKLGPLGDTKRATEMFNQLYGYFKMIFPIEDYSSAHGQFSLKSERNHPMFEAFCRILTEGDSGFEFWDYLRNLEMNSADKPYLESLKEANLFLMELANLRRFWMNIQSQVDLV
jgi:hypothetical protein